MIEEFGGGDGVRSWASILDEKAREQAKQTALLPILHGADRADGRRSPRVGGDHRFGDPDRVGHDPLSGWRRYSRSTW